MASFFGDDFGGDDYSWMSSVDYTSPATLWRQAETIQIPQYQSGNLPPLLMPPLGNPFVYQNPWSYAEHSGPRFDPYDSRFGGGLFGYDKPQTFEVQQHELAPYQRLFERLFKFPKMRDIPERIPYPVQDLPTGMGSHGPITQRSTDPWELLLMQLLSG